MRVRTHIWRWSWNQGNSILNARKNSEMFSYLQCAFSRLFRGREELSIRHHEELNALCGSFSFALEISINQNQCNLWIHRPQNSDPSLWCRKKWPNWRRKKPTPEVRNVAVLSPNYKARERCMTPHTSEGDKFEDPCVGTRSMPKHHGVNGDQGHMNRFDNSFQGARVWKSMREGKWHCRWVRIYGRWLRNKVEGRLLGNLCWIDIAVEESN